MAVSGSVLVSALLIIGAFLVNRNIYNSDNYRYLIYLLAPWSLGFGLVMNDLSRRGWAGRVAACLAAVVLLAALSHSAFRWYRDERGYTDERGVPVKVPVPAWSELTIVDDDPSESKARRARYSIPGDVSHVFGGYWDVYRMAFLSGGRVTGIPLPMFPNRFPGWSRGLGPLEGKLLVVLPEREAQGGMPSASRSPRAIRSARKADWRPAFRAVWVRDHRDPFELGRLGVVVP